MSSGKRDELAGKGKEAVGKLSGDENLEREGQGDQAKGKAKQAGEKLRDAAGDLKDSVTGKK